MVRCWLVWLVVLLAIGLVSVLVLALALALASTAPVLLAVWLLWPLMGLVSARVLVC